MRLAHSIKRQIFKKNYNFRMRVPDERCSSSSPTNHSKTSEHYLCQHQVIRRSLLWFIQSACQSVLGQDTEPQTAPDVLVGTVISVWMHVWIPVAIASDKYPNCNCKMTLEINKFVDITYPHNPAQLSVVWVTDVSVKSGWLGLYAFHQFF